VRYLRIPHPIERFDGVRVASTNGDPFLRSPVRPPRGEPATEKGSKKRGGRGSSPRAALIGLVRFLDPDPDLDLSWTWIWTRTWTCNL
jgi:hypothetical protein